MSRNLTFVILASIVLATSACTTTSSGQSKDDTTLSGETQQLQSAGAAYTGPQYTIGIVQFDNKAPAKVTGVGEAAATILRTQLETAGLKTILLDETALKEADKFIALQRTGVIKTGKKYADSGFDALDYRLSGAITAYSEVEEGIDAVVFQKKSVVARVTVDYALVDIATGKPLVAESGAGEYRKTTTGALGMGAKSTFDPNLRDGALRDALAKATEKVIRKLSTMPFQGKVLAVDSQSLTVKAGTRSQLKVGAQLAVYHVGDALRDPDSGQILGYKEDKIGVAKISSHQNENLSVAAIVSGSGFQVGDVVRLIP
jgi:curli biogenesis system outer membrane secretion channel CsgG